MALDYAKSCLIGAIMESIVYGLYFTVFLHCLTILRRKLIDGRISAYLMVTTLVLFVLITMRMVLDNKAAVEAFTNDMVTPNAADIYYTSFGNGAMFRTGTYIALTIIADIFIVYRVFAVWAWSFAAAAVPFLLAVADIVTGALFIKTIRELAAGASPDGESITMHALLFYGFTLALNLLCTFLISLRIYMGQRRLVGVNRVGPSMSVNATMEIVVESAALYSACLIGVIVPAALASNVQYCMLSVMPGIVGIAFSLIIVRVGSGLSTATATGPRSGLRFDSTSEDKSHYATEDFSRSMAPTEHSGVPVHLGSGSHGDSTNYGSDLERDGSSNEK